MLILFVLREDFIFRRFSILQKRKIFCFLPSMGYRNSVWKTSAHFFFSFPQEKSIALTMKKVGYDMKNHNNFCLYWASSCCTKGPHGTSDSYIGGILWKIPTKISEWASCYNHETHIHQIMRNIYMMINKHVKVNIYRPSIFNNG